MCAILREAYSGDVCLIDDCAAATDASSADEMADIIKERGMATGMVAEEDGKPAQVRLDDVTRLYLTTSQDDRKARQVRLDDVTCL